jgi:hypothetical protein
MKQDNIRSLLVDMRKKARAGDSCDVVVCFFMVCFFMRKFLTTNPAGVFLDIIR